MNRIKQILLVIMTTFMPLTLFSLSKDLETIEQAKREGRYVFIFLYKENDPASKKMGAVFDAAMKKIGERGQAVKINAQKSEKDVLDQFDLRSAPVPFVLVLAPNGAITGGFPSPFSEEDLLNAFASPAMEKTLKALQERKLVFLAIQNAQTAHNSQALAGINDFKSDPRFSSATTVVFLDPLDKKEEKFLKQLQIDPNVTEATTIFLAPPGHTIGKFIGPTHKEQFIKALEKSVSGCSGQPGCC